ncbi:Uncharacterised protein [Corynebacterium renale]|nr:Uncharacterised protein [Corynebacterium renale]STC95385.1 Uncharacterised protein [Corynebacterium renale]
MPWLLRGVAKKIRNVDKQPKSTGIFYTGEAETSCRYVRTPHFRPSFFAALRVRTQIPRPESTLFLSTYRKVNIYRDLRSCTGVH